ncbi:MAG: hypothetical protein K1V92_11010 [Bacteroides acidifaciens]
MEIMSFENGRKLTRLGFGLYLIVNIVFILDLVASNVIHLSTNVINTLSFLGYMPTRYNSDYSLIKNIAVNGIGLVSSIFKWSFCASFVGTVEMLRVANIHLSKTYEPSSFWTAMIISFAVIVVLELMKFIAKDKL